MRGESREQAAVDTLFAELLAAGESVPRAREVLARCADEPVLAATLRRAVPIALLEASATSRPGPSGRGCWRSSCSTRSAPRPLALRLVSSLYWHDLAEVAATPRVAGGRALARGAAC